VKDRQPMRQAPTARSATSYRLKRAPPVAAGALPVGTGQRV